MAAEPIKIGDLNSYAAVPAFTMPYRNGWQLGLDEINRNGGVLGGHPLEVISRDDGAKSAQALNIATDMVDRDGVVVLMGSLFSHVGLTLADFAKQRKILFLATMPMNDDLVWSKGNHYTFRLCASSYMQAAMLAERAARLPAKRWASIAPDYEFGRSIADNFKTLLKAKRPDVTFVLEQWPTLGALDPAATVAALEAANPDAIFNATFGSDLGKLLRSGEERGLFKNRPVISARTGEPEVLDILGDEAPKGWIVTGYPWYDIKIADHKKFVDAYLAAYEEDPRLAALIGYTAIKAIAAALDKAGTSVPDKMVTALEGLSVASPIGPVQFRKIDHQALFGSWVGKTALEEGGGVMVDWSYDDGKNFLPSPTEINRMRPHD